MKHKIVDLAYYVNWHLHIEKLLEDGWEIIETIQGTFWHSPKVVLRKTEDRREVER